MRIVSFRRSGAPIHAGISTEHGIIDIHAGMSLISEDRPSQAIGVADIVANRNEYIHMGNISILEEIMRQQQNDIGAAHWYGGVEMIVRHDDVQRVAPFHGLSGWRRTAMSMAWHQATLRRRGEHVPMSWYERPPLWAAMTNHWYGDRHVVPFPQSAMCDIECELMWVIGRDLCNVDADDAADAIVGVTLCATVVSRDLADEDVLYGLGSRAVGSIMGPMLTTMDELHEFVLPDGRLNIDMCLLVEDQVCAQMNLRDVDYPMAEVIAHASRDVVLPAGSVFSSGTLLSIPVGTHRWLVPGDDVHIDAGAIGSLQWSMEAW